MSNFEKFMDNLIYALKDPFFWILILVVSDIILAILFYGLKVKIL